MNKAKFTGIAVAIAVNFNAVQNEICQLQQIKGLQNKSKMLTIAAYPIGTTIHPIIGTTISGFVWLWQLNGGVG